MVPNLKNSLTTEEEQKLIDCVKEHPSIWNKSNPNYKNKIVKEAAWRDISIAIETEEQCLKKVWSALRAQFMGFLRKLQKPSGSGADSRPYFRHEISMQFLKESVCPTENNFTNVLPEDNGEHTTQFVTEIADINEIPCNGELEVQLNQKETDTVETIARYKECQPNRSHSKSKPKRKLDEFESEFLKMVKVSMEEDDFETFGKHVAQKIRKLSTSNLRESLNVQQAINEIIHDAELKLLD